MFAAFVGLGLATSAAGQTASAAVSAGYQIVRVPDETFPAGWSAAFAIPIHNAWAVVAEVSGAYKTFDDVSLGTDVNISTHTLAGGAQWSVRRNRRVEPFMQFLMGIARTRAGANILNRSISGTSSNLLLQPGGGVAVTAAKSIAVVAEADYRRVSFDKVDRDRAAGNNHFRLLIGLRFGL